MMDDDDDDEISIEYSSDDESEPDVALENQYYNAKSIKDEKPEKAIEEFGKVLELENEKGDWGFRALKQMIKLHFKLNQFTDMMNAYKQMLTYIQQSVTRNYSEKSINSILEHVSTSNKSDLLHSIYVMTLDALKESQNERLWFKTNSKLGKLYLENGKYHELIKIITDLKEACTTNDGKDDVKKGTQLLEVYALEIQMYTEQKNDKKLKKLYEQSLCVKSAIIHPLIMGIIRECGGKMYLREGEFKRARNDFFESFKCYDESGCNRRVQCLKYLVLASMLCSSEINPFDSQETKPYLQDPEIIAMTKLINAYQCNNITEFQDILEDNREFIMNDNFVRENVENLIQNIRKHVLIEYIKNLDSVGFSQIATVLHTNELEVESLVKRCILDEEINGKIDRINQCLIINNNIANNEMVRDMEDVNNSLRTLLDNMNLSFIESRVN